MRLTEHFTLEEMSCKCKRCKGTKPPQNIIDNLIKLAKVMEIFRTKFGKPIHINSGYRCPAHNAELPGAAKNSFHMKGLACDWHVEGMTDREMFELASGIKVFEIPGKPKNTPFRGVGYYPGRGFCHTDIGVGPPRPNTWRK